MECPQCLPLRDGHQPHPPAPASLTVAPTLRPPGPFPPQGPIEIVDDDFDSLFQWCVCLSCHSNVRYLISLQASPAPVATPSPQYLLTSSLLILSQSTHRDLCQLPLPLPWHLAGIAGKDDMTCIHIPLKLCPGDGGLNLTMCYTAAGVIFSCDVNALLIL